MRLNSVFYINSARNQSGQDQGHSRVNFCLLNENAFLPHILKEHDILRSHMV